MQVRKQVAADRSDLRCSWHRGSTSLTLLGGRQIGRTMVLTPTTRVGKPWFLATHGAQARIRIQRAQLQQNRDTGEHAEPSSMHARGGSEVTLCRARLNAHGATKLNQPKRGNGSKRGPVQHAVRCTRLARSTTAPRSTVVQQVHTSGSIQIRRAPKRCMVIEHEERSQTRTACHVQQSHGH